MRFPIERFGLVWYESLFANTKTLSALWTSLEVGTVAACFATLLGLASALSVVRYKFPGRRVFLALMTLPMLAPGIVLGVSLLLFARSRRLPDRLCRAVARPHAAGAALLHLHHHFEPLPASTAVSRMRRAVSALENGRCLGASRSPASCRESSARFSFGFTISIGEFVVSFFLTSAGTTTLPIRIYSIVKVGITPEINAVSTLILAVTAVLTTSCDPTHLVAQ